MTHEMNRRFNADNPMQGGNNRVLCVCSAGLLRSPTTADVLCGDPYNFNTRAVGMEVSFALVPIDEVLVHWADEIVVMSESHKTELCSRFDVGNRPVHVFNIPDQFGYRDPILVAAIADAADEVWGDEVGTEGRT